MNYIHITKENLDKEHICCAMSGKQSLAKKEWLRQRFDEGLVFYRSEERGKCFIEYIPAENAWVPIEAEGYLYINCLWIAGAMKGHGYSNDLLNACIRDARAQADKRGLQLEWDIPAWFGKFHDAENDCSLTETIFRYCEAVGIMAYSDTAEGQYRVVMPNVEIAKKTGKHLMIGCETMDLDEARREDGNCAISYFEEGKIYMYKCLQTIMRDVAETYDAFGFAIHDVKRWIALQPHVLPKYAEVYGK